MTPAVMPIMYQAFHAGMKVMRYFSDGRPATPSGPAHLSRPPRGRTFAAVSVRAQCPARPRAGLVRPAAPHRAGNDPLPRDPRHDSADRARPGPLRASVPSFPVQRGPPGAGSRRAALAAESPLPSLGLKLAGVGRLLDAGIRLASPPPREPLGEEQAERRDEREDLRRHVHGDGYGGGRVAESGQGPEREHEQYQGQAEEGGPGQFHHGRHGEQRQRGELDQEERARRKASGKGPGQAEPALAGSAVSGAGFL